VFSLIKQLALHKHKEERGISIICAYNNAEKLNDYLIQSLKNQTGSFELLSIDNTEGQFKSAARILNETAKKAKYEYLMFVHQDVALVSNDWLAEVQRELGSLYRLGAAGVVGMSKNGLVSSVQTGNPPYLFGSKRIDRPVRVQTLDGCLMIVPRKIFKKISFDETTIEGWYLYVVDYCLDLARFGYRVYVLPRQSYHEATSPHDLSMLEKTMKNVIEKHRNHLKTIYATSGVWQT
jgi:hypothetical protein